MNAITRIEFLARIHRIYDKPKARLRHDEEMVKIAIRRLFNLMRWQRQENRRAIAEWAKS